LCQDIFLVLRFQFTFNFILCTCGLPRYDTKENIAVNKLTAIYTRKTVKDYFDLYFLLNEYSLVDLLEQTKIKIIPPAFEDLIIALKETIFEGEELLNKSYDEGEFKKFIESLIMDILDYAKNKK